MSLRDRFKKASMKTVRDTGINAISTSLGMGPTGGKLLNEVFSRGQKAQNPQAQTPQAQSPSRPSPFSRESTDRMVPSQVQSPVAPSSRGGSSLFPTQTQDVQQPQTPEPFQMPDKFINPETGSAYGIKEYGEMMANKFSGGGQGDIGRLSAEALGVNNFRNDIASGEVDPFGVGKDSGIAYTASELKAIENAQAGIYDPALQNVFSRLETAQRIQAEQSQIAQEQREFARNLQGEKDLIGLRNQGKAQEESFDFDQDFAATILNAAALSGSVSGTANAQESLSRFIKNGDYESAYQRMINLVSSGLGGKSKTDFDNRSKDILVLNKLRDRIEQFDQENPGQMGLLNGTEEEIKRKLLGIGSGPASELATYLQRNFFGFRSDLSGAAFGAGESRDYASVNPTLSKELDLNLSVIDGALNQLNDSVDSTMESKIRGSVEIKRIIDSQKAGGSTTQTEEQFFRNNPNPTDAELDAFYSGNFKDVGNTKDSNTTNLNTAMNFVAQEEGFREKAYQDQTGKWTIGFGTTNIKGRAVKEGDTLSRQESQEIMQEQIINDYTSFSNKLGDNLTPNQFAALTSFEYNLGSGVWSQPSGQEIIKKMKERDFQGAGELMQSFNKSRNSTTRELEFNRGLANRRSKEAQLLVT